MKNIQITIKDSDIRDYLLGLLKDEVRRDELEERLFSDEDLLEVFQAVEEDLTQDYVDGDLSVIQENAFRDNFLVSEDRRQKLYFAQAFSEYTKKDLSKKSDGFSYKSFLQYFSFAANHKPVLAAVCLLIILVGTGVFVFTNNFGTNDSDIETALSSLDKAFQTKRPFQPRIAGLRYAPAVNTERGDNDTDKEKSITDKIEFDRAKTISQKEAAENKTPIGFYSLGKIYLAEKEFDRAIDLFEEASAVAQPSAETTFDLPNNSNASLRSQIENDLGVAYLEKGKVLSDRGDKGEKLNLYGKALESFDRSMKQNPKFLEPRFNRALALEEYTTRQAAQAWKDYLKLDGNSDWAKEARERLERLQEEDQSPVSAADLEKHFYQAFINKDSKQARTLISRNRELITNKYLPQTLAANIAKSGGDVKKREKLKTA